MELLLEFQHSFLLWLSSLTKSDFRYHQFLGFFKLLLSQRLARATQGVVKFAQVVGVFPGPKFDDAEGEGVAWDVGCTKCHVRWGLLIDVRIPCKGPVTGGSHSILAFRCRLQRKNIDRVDMWKLSWEFFFGNLDIWIAWVFLILSFFDVDLGVWIARVPFRSIQVSRVVVLECVSFYICGLVPFHLKLLVQWDTVSCHWTCWTCYCSPNLRWRNSKSHLGWNDAILPSLGSLLYGATRASTFFFPSVSPRSIGMTFFFHVVGVPLFQCKKCFFQSYIVWLPPFLSTVRIWVFPKIGVGPQNGWWK